MGLDTIGVFGIPDAGAVRARARPDIGRRVERMTVRLVPTDQPPPEAFSAIFQALDAESQDVIGRMAPHVLVIPIRDAVGQIIGGLWGCTAFRWLHVQMLVVPAAMRGQGIGTALMRTAEAEARRRGCHASHVDTFSFQAAPFYEKLGYARFGVLEDFPPGHARIFYRRYLGAQ